MGGCQAGHMTQCQVTIMKTELSPVDGLIVKGHKFCSILLFQVGVLGFSCTHDLEVDCIEVQCTSVSVGCIDHFL